MRIGFKLDNGSRGFEWVEPKGRTDGMHGNHSPEGKTRTHQSPRRQIRSFESNFARIIIVDDDDDRSAPSARQSSCCQGQGVDSRNQHWSRHVRCRASVLLLNKRCGVHGPFIRHFANPDSQMCLLGAKMRLEDKLGSKSQQILPMSNWLGVGACGFPRKCGVTLYVRREPEDVLLGPRLPERAHKARVRIFPVLTAPFTTWGRRPRDQSRTSRRCGKGSRGVHPEVGESPVISIVMSAWEPWNLVEHALMCVAAISRELGVDPGLRRRAG